MKRIIRIPNDIFLPKYVISKPATSDNIVYYVFLFVILIISVLFNFCFVFNFKIRCVIGLIEAGDVRINICYSWWETPFDEFYPPRSLRPLFQPFIFQFFVSGNFLLLNIMYPNVLVLF